MASSTSSSGLRKRGNNAGGITSNTTSSRSASPNDRTVDLPRSSAPLAQSSSPNEPHATTSRTRGSALSLGSPTRNPLVQRSPQSQTLPDLHPDVDDESSSASAGESSSGTASAPSGAGFFRNLRRKRTELQLPSMPQLPQGSWEALAIPNLRKYLEKPKSMQNLFTHSPYSWMGGTSSSTSSSRNSAPPGSPLLPGAAAAASSASVKNLGVISSSSSPPGAVDHMMGGAAPSRGSVGAAHGPHQMLNKPAPLNLLGAAGNAATASASPKSASNPSSARPSPLKKAQAIAHQNMHTEIVSIINDEFSDEGKHTWKLVLKQKWLRGRLLLRYYVPVSFIRRTLYTFTFLFPALFWIVLFYLHFLAGYEDGIFGFVRPYWVLVRESELARNYPIIGNVLTTIVDFLRYAVVVTGTQLLLPVGILEGEGSGGTPAQESSQQGSGVVPSDVLNAGETASSSYSSSYTVRLTIVILTLTSVGLFLSRNKERIFKKLGIIAGAAPRRDNEQEGQHGYGFSSSQNNSDHQSVTDQLDRRFQFLSSVLLYWIESSEYVYSKGGRCRRRVGRKLCWCQCCRRSKVLQPDPYHISPQENLTLLTILHDKLLKIVEVFIFDLLCASSFAQKNLEGMRQALEGAKQALYNSSVQIHSMDRDPPSVRQFLETVYTFLESVRVVFLGNEDEDSTDDEVDFFYEASSDEHEENGDSGAIGTTQSTSKVCSSKTTNDTTENEEHMDNLEGITDGTSSATGIIRKRRRSSTHTVVDPDSVHRQVPTTRPRLTDDFYLEDKMKTVAVQQTLLNDRELNNESERNNVAEKNKKPDDVVHGTTTAGKMRLKSIEKKKTSKAAFLNKAKSAAVGGISSSEPKTAEHQSRKHLHPILFVGPCLGARIVKDARPGKTSNSSETSAGGAGRAKNPSPNNEDPVVNSEPEAEATPTAVKGKNERKIHPTADDIVEKENQLDRGSFWWEKLPDHPTENRKLTAKEWLNSYQNNTDRWLASLHPSPEEIEAIKNEELLWNRGNFVLDPRTYRMVMGSFAFQWETTAKNRVLVEERNDLEDLEAARRDHHGQLYGDGGHHHYDQHNSGRAHNHFYAEQQYNPQRSPFGVTSADLLGTGGGAGGPLQSAKFESFMSRDSSRRMLDASVATSAHHNSLYWKATSNPAASAQVALAQQKQLTGSGPVVSTKMALKSQGGGSNGSLEGAPPEHPSTVSEDLYSRMTHNEKDRSKDPIPNISLSTAAVRNKPLGAAGGGFPPGAGTATPSSYDQKFSQHDPNAGPLAPPPPLPNRYEESFSRQTSNTNTSVEPLPHDAFQQHITDETYENYLPTSYKLHQREFKLHSSNHSGCSALRNILPFREVSPAEGYAVPWNVLMFAHLMRQGYTRRRVGNLFYDWRKSALEWEQDGTFAQAKLTLELYRARYNKPAVLISWSQGGRFVHSFLDWLERTCDREELAKICAQYRSPTPSTTPPVTSITNSNHVPQLYKTLHVKHWISIAAPFGGAPNALLGSLMPHSGANYHLGQVIPWVRDIDLRNLTCTWPGVAYLLPQPGALPAKSDCLIRDARGRVHARFESIIVACRRNLVEFQPVDDYVSTSSSEAGSGSSLDSEDELRADQVNMKKRRSSSGAGGIENLQKNNTRTITGTATAEETSQSDEQTDRNATGVVDVERLEIKGASDDAATAKQPSMRMTKVSAATAVQVTGGPAREKFSSASTKSGNRTRTRSGFRTSSSPPGEEADNSEEEIDELVRRPLSSTQRRPDSSRVGGPGSSTRLSLSAESSSSGATVVAAGAVDGRSNNKAGHLARESAAEAVPEAEENENMKSASAARALGGGAESTQRTKKSNKHKNRLIKTEGDEQQSATSQLFGSATEGEEVRELFECNDVPAIFLHSAHHWRNLMHAAARRWRLARAGASTAAAGVDNFLNNADIEQSQNGTVKTTTTTPGAGTSPNLQPLDIEAVLAQSNIASNVVIIPDKEEAEDDVDGADELKNRSTMAEAMNLVRNSAAEAGGKWSGISDVDRLSGGFAEDNFTENVAKQMHQPQNHQNLNRKRKPRPTSLFGMLFLHCKSRKKEVQKLFCRRRKKQDIKLSKTTESSTSEVASNDDHEHQEGETDATRKKSSTDATTDETIKNKEQLAASKDEQDDLSDASTEYFDEEENSGQSPFDDENSQPDNAKVDPLVAEYARCKESMLMSEIMACMSSKMEKRHGFRNLLPPKVPVTALVGTKIQTGYQYRYDDGIENFPTKIFYTHGDGTVPWESLVMCKFWAGKYYREKYLFKYEHGTTMNSTATEQNLNHPDHNFHELHQGELQAACSSSSSSRSSSHSKPRLPMATAAAQAASSALRKTIGGKNTTSTGSQQGKNPALLWRKRKSPSVEEYRKVLNKATVYEVEEEDITRLQQDEPVDILIMEGVGHLDTLYSKMTAEAISDLLLGINRTNVDSQGVGGGTTGGI
ncbi:unnamed protein product [Amoebophrya sp. A120]|nr:unnamed protein product [Amoebophrya sp. A120]|eukprot:GSA120T00000242001.1